jgi:HlyD family secretion protein
MATIKWNTARRWLWRALRAGAVLVLIGGIIYWIKLAPMSVTTHKIAPGEIIAEVMGTGTLEARVQTTVGPKISGRIAQIVVDQGDRVESGKLLVRLADEELKQQVAIAQANQETAQAALDRLKTDKDRATAVFDQAGKSRSRLESLISRNAASREDLDRATEAFAVAQADLARAEAAINEGQKAFVAAEKTLEYHRARLADTEISAPFDGLIVGRHRDRGDVVVPGSSILTLISTDVLWISAWVDETEMSRLKEGQPARVIFRSEPGRCFPGSVVRLGREADRETREFLVDVRVLELPTNWAVGQRAEVYLETERKDGAALLDAKYVVRRGERVGAFVDQHGRAEWRSLSLGLRSPDKVEVVRGLQSGETVVRPLDPKDSLRDGQRISPR